MSRSPQSTDVSSLLSGQRAELGLENRSVCPFCGTVAQAATIEVCGRCGMEVSPATRQSTRARVGTWSVLQSRNPSAPGMRFATLLSLIAKGHVTARSVVRGPTSFQLWRFAGQIKGLSRHFGACYACGGKLEKMAETCPHCSRSQLPPADPDVLLDSLDTAPRTPVFKEIPRDVASASVDQQAIGGAVPRPAVPSGTSAAGAAPANTAVTSAQDGFDGVTADVTGASPSSGLVGSAGSSLIGGLAGGRGVAASRGNTALPQPAAGIIAGAFDRPSPGTTGSARPNEESDRQDADDDDGSDEDEAAPSFSPERILSARDLAAAFSLEPPPAPPTAPLKFGRIITVAIATMIVVGAALVAAVPAIREPAMLWLHQEYRSMVLSQQTTGATDVPIEPNARPMPLRVPGVGTDAAVRPSAGANTKSDNSSSPTSPGTGSSATIGMAPNTTASEVAPTAARPSTGAASSADMVSASPAPSPTPAPTVTPTPSEPPTPAAPIPPPPPAVREVVRLPGETDLDLARRCYRKALDAEGRGDFRTAVACYEQIERMPPDNWQGDVDLRLHDARKHLPP